jgi:hypothetical protein
MRTNQTFVAIRHRLLENASFQVLALFVCHRSRISSKQEGNPLLAPPIALTQVHDTSKTGPQAHRTPDRMELETTLGPEAP